MYLADLPQDIHPPKYVEVRLIAHQQPDAPLRGFEGQQAEVGRIPGDPRSTRHADQ